jgi:hypothetical protein
MCARRLPRAFRDPSGESARPDVLEVPSQNTAVDGLPAVGPSVGVSFRLAEGLSVLVQTEGLDAGLWQKARRLKGQRASGRESSVHRPGPMYLSVSKNQ